MRLIDADALLHQAHPMENGYFHEQGGPISWRTKGVTVREIDAAPTVRCGECGAYNVDGVHAKFCRWDGEHHESDWFCAYFERRET